MKKIYVSPKAHIICVGNNVICTSDPSGELNQGMGDGTTILAPERYGRGRYDAEYDIY